MKRSVQRTRGGGGGGRMYKEDAREDVRMEGASAGN
jgi:hypothetical protein